MGSVPPESEKIEFVDSGQISIARTGAPLPEKKEQEKEKCERCSKVTEEELKQIFTSASSDIIKEVLTAFKEGSKFFEINSFLRKAHFFAQALKEVGSGFVIKTPESLNYRTDGLINWILV